MKRSERAGIARQTAGILEVGHYDAGGRRISIAEDLRRARGGTVLHGPDEPTRVAFDPRPTRLEVALESTLAGARRLVGEGHDVAALVFASARNPGGGFLKGAHAQEESLARSSGLHACLVGSPFYEANRADPRDGLYQHHLLHSPGVPVFRDDEGALLPVPWRVAFLTSPAVNAGVYRERHPDGDEAIRRTMAERTDRVLAAAVRHRHDGLVLGAWGCGVFRNRPPEIAGVFREALEGKYRGAFSRVSFSILGDEAFEAFRAAFPEAR